MAPASTSKTANTSKTKREKVFHPSSRKAGQLARKALRKGKMGNLAAKRSERHDSLVDLYGFFYHAVPEEGVLTLEEIHHIIQDVWLTRFDDELESERAARRKGRPKSTKEMKLEELKLREAEIYRTGMEVIDLTNPPTVELFRRWDQKEVAYMQLLRFIRIFSTDPNLVVVSKPGRHVSIVGLMATPQDDAMDLEEEAPTLIPEQPMILGEPASRFASTMMTMDDIPS